MLCFQHSKAYHLLLNKHLHNKFTKLSKGRQSQSLSHMTQSTQLFLYMRLIHKSPQQQNHNNHLQNILSNSYIMFMRSRPNLMIM